MLKSLMKLTAAAFLAAASPAFAQVQEVDPNQAVAAEGSYQNPDTGAASDTTSPEAAPGFEWNAPEAQSQEATPIETETQTVLPEDEAAETAAAPANTAAPGTTVAREDVFTAAEGLFGRGAEGLAGILENILRDQGEPTAYISGQEASGAFIFGVRYGSGTMHHSIEGDRNVYWTGPSIGFDVGADANKVFVLVYNLHDSQDLFKRFPGAEGHAYFVGGFNAQYMRRGDVVLIPIRLGVGLRLGVNAGYMRFSERNRWLPF
jgi:hypothetical protein